MVATEDLAPGKLIVRNKYDRVGNCTEYAVFNLNGPALNSWNIHRCVMVYNSLNQETERRWYDVSGNLTTYNTDKYAIVRYKYDLLGNVVSTAYFGVDKKPVKCNEGWASTLNVYNKMGKIVKQSFFDINGNPTDPKLMVPVGICDYDKWGNMTFIASQDGHGHYIINPQTGWAILRMTYDSHGNCLSRAYFNVSDKPMANSDGYHKETYKFNNDNNCTEHAYFGTDGKPMLYYSIHRETYAYDTNGNQVLMELYGISGSKRSTATQDGISAQRPTTKTTSRPCGNTTTQQARNSKRSAGTANHGQLRHRQQDPYSLPSRHRSAPLQAAATGRQRHRPWPASSPRRPPLATRA